MKLIYKKDICNNDILTDDDDNQIMMEWEKPYMEECIKLLKPKGRVLEIGFGLAYSATSLCLNNNVTSYNVIECAPIVWDEFEKFKINIQKIRPNLKMNLIKGRWQDILETQGIFDTIFFDDYIGVTIDQNTDRMNKFLYSVLTNHSTIGTRISAYSTSYILNTLNCINLKITEFYPEIPAYCKYAKNIMYIPIIEKISECDPEIKKKLFLFNTNNIKINKPENPQIDIFLIDNFYTNPIESQEYALKKDFSLIGNFPGKRTISFTNEKVKSLIQAFIEPCSGKIIDFPMEKTDTNFNGCYEYTNSFDRTRIKYGIENNNNWVGILYLTKNASQISGTSFYTPYNKYVNIYNETDEYLIKKQLDDNEYDINKWNITDTICNKFNRLLLFRANKYYSCTNYFGNNDNNGRLTQLFYFTTER